MPINPNQQVARVSNQLKAAGKDLSEALSPE